jgi:hypothetical protein
MKSLTGVVVLRTLAAINLLAGVTARADTRRLGLTT